VFYIKRNKLTGSKNNKVTIVFDGRFGWEGARTESDFELIFSGERPADEVIKERVRRYKNKKQIVVVSNDRDIINYVRSYGAGMLSVEDFIRRKEEKKVYSQKDKNIDYRLQREITEELKRRWLGEC
jgi:predicted RNA-binding protein with PIN domain